MSKVNLAILDILVFVFVFGLNPNGYSVEPCIPPPECPSTTSTFPGETQYADSWMFKWAADNPQSITPGESVTVKVKGGFPGYEWQVSGEGFSLTESETANRSNTLNAEDSACGVATITVKDYQNKQAQGTVGVIDETFVWDYSRTGSGKMNRNSHKDIYVTGGSSPYTFVIESGNGFYFDQAFTQTEITTTRKAVTIYTDETACGSAHISVTDNCENIATGSVQCTVGEWGPWSQNIEVNYCGYYGYANQDQEICDNPAYQMKWLVGGAGIYDPCPNGCITFCSENCCKTFCTGLGYPTYSKTAIKERKWGCPD